MAICVPLIFLPASKRPSTCLHQRPVRNPESRYTSPHPTSDRRPRDRANTFRWQWYRRATSDCASHARNYMLAENAADFPNPYARRDARHSRSRAEGRYPAAWRSRAFLRLSKGNRITGVRKLPRCPSGDISPHHDVNFLPDCRVSIRAKPFMRR